MDIPSISLPLIGQRHNANYSLLDMDEPFGFVAFIEHIILRKKTKRTDTPIEIILTKRVHKMKQFPLSLATIF
jgi:hypothetical protein